MKIVPGALDDDRLVAHRRHVGAAGRARAHHRRDLRDPLRRHPRLVEEDPAEVVAVGEDLVLERQEGAARVDEVDARQPVLLGDLLGAQVLLDRHREVGAALDRGVVGDDHALLALDDADPGDDSRAGRLTLVELPGCERAELEEGGAGVDEPVDPLARGHLPARPVALDGLLAASSPDLTGALAQLGDEGLHPVAALRERLGLAFDLRRQQRHDSEPSHAIGLRGGSAKRRLCRRAALLAPRPRPQSRPYSSGYERSLRPCLGTTIAPRRRATFRQTPPRSGLVPFGHVTESESDARADQ